jgi:hypothetical protein
MELPAAAATVADVNFRLTLYRLKLSVLLEISEEYVQKKNSYASMIYGCLTLILLLV